MFDATQKLTISGTKGLRLKSFFYKKAGHTLLGKVGGRSLFASVFAIPGMVLHSESLSKVRFSRMFGLRVFEGCDMRSDSCVPLTILAGRPQVDCCPELRRSGHPFPFFRNDVRTSNSRCQEKPFAGSEACRCFRSG